jgi:hypothetical protein
MLHKFFQLLYLFLEKDFLDEKLILPDNNNKQQQQMLSNKFEQLYDISY